MRFHPLLRSLFPQILLDSLLLDFGEQLTIRLGDRTGIGYVLGASFPRLKLAPKGRLVESVYLCSHGTLARYRQARVAWTTVRSARRAVLLSSATLHKICSANSTIAQTNWRVYAIVTILTPHSTLATVYPGCPCSWLLLMFGAASRVAMLTSSADE